MGSNHGRPEPGPETEKSIYQKIIDGEQQPEGIQKGWSNLEKRKSFNMMDPDELREISRKGAAAVNKLHGEKKTAKEALEKILTLRINDQMLSAADLPRELADKLKRDNPDATLYDLINLVAVGRAVGGNLKAYELIRDTYGDKPIDRVEVTENITTDADRAMLRQIAERLQAAETVQIIEGTATETAAGDDGTGDG